MMPPSPHPHNSTLSAAVNCDDEFTMMLASKTGTSSVSIIELPHCNVESSPEQKEPQLQPRISKLIDNTTSANRFTAAQRDRTLRHHTILQPTLSQEKLHLSRLRAERNIEHSSSTVSLLTMVEEDEDESIDVLCNSTSSANLEDRGSNNEVCIKFEGGKLSPGVRGSNFTASTASISECSSDQEDDSFAYDEESISVSSPYPMVLKSNMPLLCQPCELNAHSPTHRFVVCADTQFGITKHNLDWDVEIQYSNQAIDLINKMSPRPAFVCVCGDLVDMEFSLERKKGSKSKFPSSLFNGETGKFDVCSYGTTLFSLLETHNVQSLVFDSMTNRHCIKRSL